MAATDHTRDDRRSLTPQWTVAPSVRRVTSRSDWPGRIALAAVFVALCFSITPDGFVWNGDEVNNLATEGSLARRVQWLPLFLFAGYVVWRRRILATAYLRDVNPFLIAFVLFATVTVLWSPVPGVTLRKLFVLYGALTIGIAFQVAGWRPDRYADTARVALTLMLVVSLVLSLAMPTIGVMPDGEFAGNWRGATSHKNLLAALASMGGLLWTHALAVRRTTKLRFFAALGLVLVLLVMSGGKTGLATLIVSAPIVWLINRPPVSAANMLSVAFWVVLLVLTPLLLFVVVVFGGIPGWTTLIGPIAELFGKDPTLTSRDQIWAMMWAQIQQHWILGYGYNSFWLGPVGPSGDIIDAVYWTPWQAHNGYIDILNETGIVGLTLVCAFLIAHLLQIGRMCLFDLENGSLHLGIALLVLLANITESSLFSGLSLYSLLLLYSSLSVTRALSRHVAELGGVRPDPGVEYGDAQPANER